MKIKKILHSSIIMVMLLTTVVTGEERSPEWARVRKSFAQKHQRCLICGIEKKSLQIHHVVPFSINPDLELEKNNLIPLCTSKYWGYNDHLVVGHAQNFKLENPWVLLDIVEARKISNPKYIETNGDDEWIVYKRMMKKRCREFNKLEDEEKEIIRKEIKEELEENEINLETLEESLP
jgi:hypothetical protein